MKTSATDLLPEVRVPWARPYFTERELELASETIRSGWLSQGPRVAELESRIATLTAIPRCIALNSGTAALDVALKIVDVGRDDEVIIPAFAYIATASSVLYQSATPVFADIDPVTFNMDPADAAKRVTSRTKAIIAIDYGGHGADWTSLRALAREHGIALIEDAAPGFGGSYRGQALGSHGDLGITSFHTAKVFTSVEGGALFCSTDEQAALARTFRSQGESPTEKYVHPVLGHNYRMSDLHAAIGIAQLERYNDVLSRRAASAAYYTEQLKLVRGVTTPRVDPDCTHAWFLYTVRIANRDHVRTKLRAAGIETNVSWPYPVYAQAPYKKYRRHACPQAELACNEVIALPLYFELTQSDQDFVVRTLNDAING